MIPKIARVVFLISILCLSGFAQEGWWMREPIRLVQTNLRETDTALDPTHLATQLAQFNANVLLFGMGGIVAHYPTDVPFHYRSPHLAAGQDTFGAMLRQAQVRGIRVIGRFDFSKTRKEVFDAHPEWFFRQSNGDPVAYHDLYSTCINGGYYRGQAMIILAEALERYRVDGLFFNMFGNPSTDYSGRNIGLCHCDSCRRLFRQRFGRDLPEQPDADYEQFMFASSREVAANIAQLIHSKRPEAGFFTYIQEHTDGIMSESNTAVRRPLPLWPYSASDNVNRARTSEPGKMAVNLCMSFVDFPWRFATVPGPEVALRLWQNVAHGGAAALAMVGTMDQQDQQALDAARPIYEWLARNQEYVAGQRSAARLLLLGRPPNVGRSYGQNSYRGLFRLLTEQHIPFVVSDNLKWLEAPTREFDLVIAANWAPAELEGYVRQGGNVLLASAQPPSFEVGKLVRRWNNVEGYFRIQSADLFPSLGRTKLIFLNGDYLEYESQGNPELTLVPPSTFGPPEKVHIDQVETNKPGLWIESRGKGRLAVVPWDIGGLYYLHSSTGHSGLLADLIDRLLPEGRQLKTNAHPLVEITLMRQGTRTMVHFINISGHSQTGYFPPVPMQGIQLDIKGRYRQARTLKTPGTLQLTLSDNRTRFTLPTLTDYEVAVLE